MYLYYFVGDVLFQAEDGIRDYKVTGVQTCALPILEKFAAAHPKVSISVRTGHAEAILEMALKEEIGRASCRERVKSWLDRIYMKRVSLRIGRSTAYR